MGQLGNSYECDVGHEYMTSLLALAIIFHVTAIMMMWSTLYFGLKYGHFGSNLVWPLMWFLEPHHCASNLVGFVAFLHAMMSVIGLIMFISLFCLSKSSFSAKFWRYLTLLSLGVMAVCFLVILLGFLVPD